METNSSEKRLPKFTPTNPDGAQRVIKQITVINPKKLRVAGLDLKMAEALKKSKVRAPSNTFGIHSKDDKLAIAKSILNKKLNQTQLSGELTKHGESTQNTVEKSIDVAINMVSFSNTTKVAATKPQIKVAALKSLMPSPTSSTSRFPCTMLLNFLKYDPKTCSIKMNIVDPSLGPAKKTRPYQILKASIKRLKGAKVEEGIAKTIETKVISSGVTFKIKKKLEDKVTIKGIAEVLPNMQQVKSEQEIKYTPPQEHLPKVIESKILSTEEKIDISTLSKKFLAGTIPLPVYQQDNLILCKAEEANIKIQKAKANVQNASQSLAGMNPLNNALVKPVLEEESAVDFINSLKFMRDTQSNVYTSK